MINPISSRCYLSILGHQVVLRNQLSYLSPLSSYCRCLLSPHSVLSGQKQSSSSQKVDGLRSLFCMKNVSHLSTESENHAPAVGSSQNEEDLSKKKSSLIKRFKDAYAIYGKVTLVTHGVTSCLWFGAFYSLSISGINLLDIMHNLNAPEWLTKPLHLGGGTVNNLATALLFYKLAAPFRYGLTLVLSRYLVRYLRLKGKAPQVQESDRLRNLAKEGAQISRDQIRARMARSRRNMLARRSQR
ncbi:unnamed protein product [Heterobilharzia americana]|nr:unnamed protein product [Heterobilharzia americana]